MGCIGDIRAIFRIFVIVSIILLAFVSPQPMKVFGAVTDTVQVTFDPDGNVSLDISPTTYAFSTVYANSSESSTNNYFTMWNNGSMNNMFTDIKITTDAANMVCYDGQCLDIAVNDTYALKVYNGDVSNATWCWPSEYRDLDNDLDRGTTDAFGFTIYISNLSSNISAQSVTMTVQSAYS